jgi:transmembrane sensor
MNQIFDFPTVAKAAGDWFARLHAPDCSDAEREAFERWLAADPEHRREYRNMESMWQAMGSLQSVYAPQAKAQPVQSVRFNCRRLLPLSAAAVLVLAVGILWQSRYFAEQNQQFSTAVGQQSSVTLADGSVLELNTDTAVTVHYTRSSRELQLDHGELFVHVAHLALRPFVVKAGAGETRDIGTQFSVYLKPEATTVTVFEGEVQVTSGTESTNRSISDLHGGERLAYNDKGRQFSQEAIDIEALQAWRHGDLIFRDQTLAQVIAEIERYHHVQVKLSSTQLAAQRVSGVFKTQDLHGIIAAIAALLDIQARWSSPEQVLLSDARQR